MDKDHRLDAPDNEALRTIEQLEDRSGLTTIYPHAHQEWEGVDIMSRDDREKKLSDDKLRISLSLRKWFVVIGILIPLPMIIMGLVASTSAEYFDLEKLGLLILPLLIVTGGLLYASYKGFLYAYSLFYTHGTWGLPFVVALLGLLGLSLHASFLLTEPLHTGNTAIDALIISGALLIASIIYSGLLVLIWTSPRLGSGTKMAFVGVMILATLLGTALFYFG